MKMTSDHERVVVMLKESISLLCRTALSYNVELTVEGLIGITLDREDVLLVNIKDSFMPDGEKKKSMEKSELNRNRGRRTKFSFEKRRKRRKSSDSESDPAFNQTHHSDGGDQEGAWEADSTDYSVTPQAKNNTENRSSVEERRHVSNYLDDETYNRNIKREDFLPIELKKEIIDETDDVIMMPSYPGHGSALIDTQTSKVKSPTNVPGQPHNYGSIRSAATAVFPESDIGLVTGQQSAFPNLPKISSGGRSSSRATHQFENRKYPKTENPQLNNLSKSQTIRSHGRIIGVVCPKEGCIMYECTTCKTIFQRRKTLLFHNREQHGLPGGYSCPICGQLFGQKCNMFQHMDTHSHARSHVCVCGKTFRHRPALVKHNKICQTYLDKARGQSQTHAVVPWPNTQKNQTNAPNLTAVNDGKTTTT